MSAPVKAFFEPHTTCREYPLGRESALGFQQAAGVRNRISSYLLLVRVLENPDERC